jgi:ribosomal protein L12E/L44/L45/RPP1/RPP2
MSEQQNTLNKLAQTVIDTYEQATKQYIARLETAHIEYLQILGHESEHSEALAAATTAASSTAAAGKTTIDEAKAQQASEEAVANSVDGLYLSGEQLQAFTDLLGKLAEAAQAIGESIKR